MGRGALPELVSLSVSAWNMKVRFALKHHGIQYRTTPYLPIVGEFLLRLRLWEWRRKLTVPVLFTPKDGVISQSYDIVRWADSHSARPGAEPLFPPGVEPEIRSWNDRSDTVLYYGRQCLVEGLLENPSEMRAMVPPALRWMGPVGALLVRAITLRLRNKYRAEGSSSSLDKALAVLREAQSALRSRPPGPDGLRHLVGGALSYADVTVAVAVQLVAPLGPPFAVHPRPGLKQMLPYREEFSDLVSWRDGLYARYYPVTEAGKGGKAE